MTIARSAVLHIIVIWLLLIACPYQTPVAIAQNSMTSGVDAVQSYQKNRQKFVDQQKSTSKSFQSTTSALQQDIDSLNQEISKANQQLNQIQSKISANNQTIDILRRVQTGFSAVLFPMLSGASLFAASLLPQFIDQSWVMIILYFFLAMTIVNIFLHIRKREQPIYTRYRKPLIVTVIVLICLIASPLLANDLTKRNEVIEQLIQTEKVLTLSDHERFIAILEAKANHTIDIPDLASGDPLFKVYRQVTIDTPEYWFTLAALYTHAGKNGKALEAIKQLTKFSRLDSSEDHRIMVLNSINYLLQQKQTEMASSVVDTLSTKLLDVTALLELAKILQKNGMQVSAEKVLGLSVERASTVADLVKLATFLIDNARLDKGGEALDKALQRARTITDLILIAETAITLNRDTLITQLTAKAGKVLTEQQEQIQLVDLFLKNGRKENAVILFKDMIEDVTSRTESSTEKLLSLIESALERDLLPQATSATERLYFNLGSGSETFGIQLQTKLRTAKGLPDEDKIMLPQFYGLLNEEQGINDEAEVAYIKAVLSSLKSILVSYGYELPESLNNFYLLGRLWIRADREDMINQLDRVYSIIEQHFIKQQNLQNERKVEAMKLEIKTLENDRNAIRTNIDKKNAQAAASLWKKIVQTFSTLATGAFILAAIIGCILVSYRYCQTLSLYRSYGFFGKFVESTGWLQVLSILGCLTGVIQVLAGQFLQIFGQNQDNTLKLFRIHQQLQQNDKPTN